MVHRGHSRGKAFSQSNLPYLESQGDLVSRLIMGITGDILSLVGVINLLLSPTDPPSRQQEVNPKPKP